MRFRLNLVLKLALLVSYGIVSSAHARQMNSTPEQQAVIDSIKNGPMGIELDFDSWARSHADEWSYWRVGNQDTRPRDEHMMLVKEYVDAGNRPTAFELEPIDVIIRGDIALLRLIATEELRSPGGEERVVRYASAAMLVREGGGWKMLATNIVYLD